MNATRHGSVSEARITTHALPRKRPVQDHLPRGPADLPDRAGPHVHPGAARVRLRRRAAAWPSDYLFRAILIPFLIMSLAALGREHAGGLLRPDLARFRRVHGGRRVRRVQLLRARSRHAAAAGAGARRTVRDGLRHPVRPAQPAREGPVSRRRHAGRAVLQRLDVPAHQVVHQRLVFGFGVRVAACRCLGSRIESRRAAKYLFCLAMLVRAWRCWPRTWCAARSAASGWPSATWTWPRP